MALKVLYVEDNEGDARLLREAFAASGHDVELKHFTRAALALVELYAHGAELVVLDLLLAGDDRGLIVHELEASPRLRHIPVIVLTGSRLPAQELVPQAERYDSKPLTFEGWMNLACAYFERARAHRRASAGRRARGRGRSEAATTGIRSLHPRPQ
jgi:CheY-like chemotaxis protein